ncbi:hypothetical protein NDU88_000258 [Pleurodeles waltl]|uniref:Uncharacterized protein n=1 Tax=Pleurodeles waltl TaxID=8319 RepID=A0AAV7MGB5_PLEWA|nr:hypothetical protein NDU88_000258 [Pleurodeles waltl]
MVALVPAALSLLLCGAEEVEEMCSRRILKRPFILLYGFVKTPHQPPQDAGAAPAAKPVARPGEAAEREERWQRRLPWKNLILTVSWAPSDNASLTARCVYCPTLAQGQRAGGCLAEVRRKQHILPKLRESIYGLKAHTWPGPDERLRSSSSRLTRPPLGPRGPLGGRVRWPQRLGASLAERSVLWRTLFSSGGGMWRVRHVLLARGTYKRRALPLPLFSARGHHLAALAPRCLLPLRAHLHARYVSRFSSLLRRREDAHRRRARAPRPLCRGRQSRAQHAPPRARSFPALFEAARGEHASLPHSGARSFSRRFWATDQEHGLRATPPSSYCTDEWRQTAPCVRPRGTRPHALPFTSGRTLQQRAALQESSNRCQAA